MRPSLANYVLLAVALAALLGTSAPAAAQSSEEAREAPKRAILIRNPDRAGGAPPYALADQYGRVQRLVEPSPRVDLRPHVGQTVRIAHDTGGTLLASQLLLPSDGPNSSPVSTADYALDPELGDFERVSPAQFTPPSRLRRIAEPAPRPARRRPRPTYRLAQAEADSRYGESILDRGMDALGEAPTAAGADPTEPIVLEDVLGESGEFRSSDDLPPPSESSLEPIPVGDVYYPEGDAFIDGPAPSGMATHGDDCPQCRAKASKPTAAAPCPTCNPIQCQQGGGFCGPSCCPPSRRGLYGRVDYLLWWFDGFDTPPLVTTNDQGAAPILGNPGTRVIYGGELLDGARNGLRFTAGAWLDDQRDIAIEGDLLFFETESESFSFNDPAGATILGRPFYNIAPVFGGVVQPPAGDAQLVSFPAEVAGALSVYARTEFESAGLRLRTGICCRDIGGCGPCGCDSCRSGLGGLGGGRGGSAISRVDFLVGYRYANLEDQLTISENLTDLVTTGQVAVVDQFRTENEFHGVDLGFVYDWQSRRWGLELLSKIAVGSTRQRVTINGATTRNVAGAVPATSSGGLLAQDTNIGSYADDRFSVLPELSARLSYRITPQLSVSAGYTLVYWATVVRPGDQIDLSVDGRLAADPLVVPTALSHPRLDVEETSLWAHGLNLGVDYRY